MQKVFTAILLGLMIFGLAACEKSSTDILDKAKGISSAEALKEAIGDPDKIDKVGPVANWTYQTSDGEVTFTIVGDNVTVSTAKSKD
jgi:hypothetical protein